MPRLPYITARRDGESDEAYKSRDSQLRTRMSEAAGMPESATKDFVTKQIKSEMMPEVSQKLSEYGANLLDDKVNLTVTLGSLFFDLYEISAPPPAEAPMAQLLHKKKREELATRLEGEEFALTKAEIATVRPALEDPKVWETVKISASYTVGEEKRYVSLTNKAAPFFGSVVNAAVEYILENEK
jgi:hypothetical protein